MKQKLFTLLTLALFFCSGAWAETFTYNFEGANPLADWTITKSNATCEVSIQATGGDKYHDLADPGSAYLAYGIGSTSGNIKLTSITSYENVSNITLKEACTDNGKPTITIRIVNGEGEVQKTVLDEGTHKDNFGNPSTKKWSAATSFALDVPTTGYIEIYLNSSSTNKFGGFDDIVITTVASHTVTYKANGGTGDDVVDNKAFTIADCSFTAPSGKLFTGWNTAADGSGTDYAVGASVSSDLTLFAQWIEGVEETITYVVKTTAAASTTASTHLTNLVNETSVGIAAVTDQSKTDRSGKYATSSTEGYGVQFTFDVAAGYTFHPTAITMQVSTVSTTDFTFQVTLTDSKGTKLTSNALNTFSKDGVLTDITFPSYDKTFASGTVTMLVTAVRAGGSGTYRIGKTITIKGAVNDNVPITPAKTYTTYVTPFDLDFTSTDKLTAYIATAATSSAVTLTSVDKVPQGTPIVLKATETLSAIAVNVAASTDDVTGNLLLAGDGTTTIGGDTKYDYILSDGKFYRAEEGTVAVGKAYLHLDADPGAHALDIFFEENGDVTGVTAVAKPQTTNNASFYDLQGRRVAQPTKGLYIVNGKKVIVK